MAEAMIVPVTSAAVPQPQPRPKAPAFAEGDVVTLNSGGPKMTVTGLAGVDSIQCQWFNDDQELKAGSFRPAWLRKAEGGKK